MTPSSSAVSRHGRSVGRLPLRRNRAQWRVLRRCVSAASSYLWAHVRCSSMLSAALSHSTHRVHRSNPTWPMLNELAGGPRVLGGSLLPSSTWAQTVATFAAAIFGLRDSPSYRGRGGGGGGLRRRGCGSGQGVGQVLSGLGLARLGGLGAHAGRRGAGRPPRAARGHGPRLEMNGTRAGGRVSGAMLAVLAWPCASRSGQTRLGFRRHYLVDTVV